MYSSLNEKFTNIIQTLKMFNDFVIERKTRLIDIISKVITRQCKIFCLNLI